MSYLIIVLFCLLSFFGLLVLNDEDIQQSYIGEANGDGGIEIAPAGLTHKTYMYASIHTSIEG